MLAAASACTLRSAKNSARATSGISNHGQTAGRRSLRGARRYSAEILLGPGDRIILDDDSVVNLEARTMCLVPATLYSRLLARSTAAA